MTKLKPCPFCGGIGTLWSIDQCDTVYAVCQDCGARTVDYKHAGQAITVWNRRAQPENKPADAVPVVRCGECKYYEPHIDYLTGKPYRFGECEKIGERDQEGGACFSRDTDDDDFCSYGERKEYV